MAYVMLKPGQQPRPTRSGGFVAGQVATTSSSERRDHRRGAEVAVRQDPPPGAQGPSRGVVASRPPRLGERKITTCCQICVIARGRRPFLRRDEPAAPSADELVSEPRRARLGCAWSRSCQARPGGRHRRRHRGAPEPDAALRRDRRHRRQLHGRHRRHRSPVPGQGVETVGNTHRKSGALNMAWRRFATDADIVVTVDADTELDANASSDWEAEFLADDRLGGSTAKFTMRPGKGMLLRWQRLEFATSVDVALRRSWTSVLAGAGAALATRPCATSWSGDREGPWSYASTVEDFELTHGCGSWAGAATPARRSAPSPTRCPPSQPCGASG